MLFPISSRQKRSLVFLLIAIMVSWCCCYWVDLGFGILSLTQVLTSGAFIYGNKAFLCYKIRQSVVVAFVLFVIVSLGGVVVDSFKWFDPYVLGLVFSYLLVTFTLKMTQKHVRLNWPQLFIGTMLFLLDIVLIHSNPAFTDSRSAIMNNTSFFISQLLTGTYAVSLLAPSDEERSLATSPSELGLYVRLQDQTIFQFLMFILSTLICSGLLYSLILLIGEQPKAKLISDFEANTEVFYDIKNYVNKIDPEHKIQEIDFDIEENKVFYITVDGEDATNGYGDMDSWKPVDSLLKATPWTKASFTILKEKLDKIDCKSIKPGVPFVIGHKRIGSYYYYYDLFDRPADHFPYDDPCRYIRYNDNVIIESRHLSQYDSDCFSN